MVKIKEDEVNSVKKRGVTLLELLIVVMIVGVLATLATVSYTGIKEETVDKEAKANLRLILAAQRIYRMEVGRYYPYDYGTISNIGDINTKLKLLLSTAANRSWNYSVTSAAGDCCGQATRTAGPKNWRMLYSSEPDPVLGTCP